MKSSKDSRSNPKTKLASASGSPWCVTLVLVLIAFSAGLFIGSIFLDAKSAATVHTAGIPGTNNVLQTWRPPALPSLPSHLRGPIATKPDPIASPQTASLRQNPPITVSDADAGQRASFAADLASFMVAPVGLDNADILVAAWIYLDNSPTHDGNMRTIFSNKLAGCEAADGQHGISMFVNAWQQTDHKLHIEYGSQSSGCRKLDSLGITLEVHRWYHVAAFFGSEEVALFINGQEVNRAAVEEPHIPQPSNSFLVGRYAMADNEYSFYGNISSIAIVHSESASADMVIAMQQQANAHSIAGIKAYYPLDDAKASNPTAHDLIGGHDGHYELPVAGEHLDGIPIKLVDGRSIHTITEDMITQSNELGRNRREKIKEGMQHTWNSYKKHAWGRDELRPISGTGRDNWGGMGVTLVDSLDTLWIMGLKAEFNEARDWVSSSLSFNRAGSVSVFETTIRELGGLLSAFDLSGERVFLDKAKELGDRLLPAFKTTSGIPVSHVNLNTGASGGGWTGNSAVLSELGSLQLEFRYLGDRLQDPLYTTISMKAIQKVLENKPSNGLFPIRISIANGGFADSTITFGALGDSFYEYLLKLWLQTNKKEQWLRDAYDKAMDGAISHLLLTSHKTGLAFLGDWDGHSHNRKMDHLVCFMPGLLTLGVYTSLEGIDSKRSQRDLAVARALMYTCREMYHRTATGIAPEYVRFAEYGDMEAGPGAEYYILRPETVESLFIMSQLTKEPIYRDWAWEIWEAIDHTLRTPLAYASLHNVNQGSSLEDRMESFFLAETMKYLYLSQDPDMPIDLTKYVFNTEAHPMRIFDP